MSDDAEKTASGENGLKPHLVHIVTEFIREQFPGYRVTQRVLWPDRVQIELNGESCGTVSSTDWQSWWWHTCGKKTCYGYKDADEIDVHILLPADPQFFDKVLDECRNSIPRRNRKRSLL